MTLRYPVLATVALAACAGGGMARSSSAPSAAPAPDAFECVQKQIKAVGFTQTSHDTDDLRLTARKYDESARRSDVTFRRLIDRLEVQVSPGAEGEVSRISVVATTFAERTTHRGPTEEQERTSEGASAAARTILEKCGGAAAVSDSVVPQS